MNQSPALNRGQWMVLIAAFLGWMFDGVEIGLFPLVARPALQELLLKIGDADIGWWNNVVVACFLFGAAIGGLLFGWLGDKIGRVRAMVISILTYSLFTGAGYFATEAWHLGLFRFIASLGMGGEWAVAVALVVECWPEKFRPMLAGAIGAAANFGFLFIAVIAYLFPVTPDSWRWMMLVGAAPAVLALFVIRAVPESERWKRSVRQQRRTLPIVEIFGARLWKTTVLGIVFSAIPLIGTWAAVSGTIPLWVEQMKQAELIDRALRELPDMRLSEIDKMEPDSQLKVAKTRLTESQWKEADKTAAQAKAGVQIVLAIGAILGCFIAPIVGGLWGRRPVYFALCLLSLISCAYLFRYLAHYDWLFLAVAGFVGGVTAAFYGWLPLYLPELFPTHVRATGQGLSFNFGRIFAAVGSLVAGSSISVSGGNYAVVMAGITLVYGAGLILIWLGPETKGKPLPD
jgi:SHS family sialic acid transporter-like MFS transporter